MALYAHLHRDGDRAVLVLLLDEIAPNLQSDRRPDTYAPAWRKTCTWGTRSLAQRDQALRNPATTNLDTAPSLAGALTYGVLAAAPTEWRGAITFDIQSLLGYALGQPWTYGNLVQTGKALAWQTGMALRVHLHWRPRAKWLATGLPYANSTRYPLSLLAGSACRPQDNPVVCTSSGRIEAPSADLVRWALAQAARPGDVAAARSPATLDLRIHWLVRVDAAALDEARSNLAVTTLRQAGLTPQTSLDLSGAADTPLQRPRGVTAEAQAALYLYHLATSEPDSVEGVLKGLGMRDSDRVATRRYLVQSESADDIAVAKALALGAAMLLAFYDVRASEFQPDVVPSNSTMKHALQNLSTTIEAAGWLLTL